MISTLARQYFFYQLSQHWNRQQIEAHQDVQLRKLIRHAGRKVPYYRALFKEIGLDPQKFSGREEMERIPLLDKETVRTRAKDLIAEDASRYGIVWESTSGSTGTPLRVIVDRGARANKLAALIRSYQWAGYRLGKKTFSLQSYYLKGKCWQYHPWFRVLRFDSVRLCEETAQEVLKVMGKLTPRFFMGFPFDLLMLAQFAAKAGIKIPSPDGMVTYGETLSNEKRQSLEAAYGCGVFDFYSQHECAAMIAECPHHSLHLVDDFAYHEIINLREDQAGEQAVGSSDSGQAGMTNTQLMGELVGTGLYNFAMPLIRYRTRDDVALEDNSECTCGCCLPVIKAILGKQCDYLQTPDGRLLGAVMSHAIDNGQGVVTSQVVQDALDHIYVNLIVDDTYSIESEKALERDLRKRLGDQIKIEFRQVSQLEKRPGGKTPFILSKIGYDYV